MLHCFHFLSRLAEGRLIQSHAEKNKIIAERWRQMSEVEKTPYFEHAKEGACGTRGQPVKSWKEASRIIRNLESNVCSRVCTCTMYVKHWLESLLVSDIIIIGPGPTGMVGMVMAIPYFYQPFNF